LILSALGSLIFSAVGLSFENKLNYFIAYSSVGQFGFMLFGLACYPNIQSLNSVLFYLFFYSITMCGFFMTLPTVFSNAISNNSISYFCGLYKFSPFLAVIITIFLSSLAGLPPFLGFFAKYHIFVAMLSSDMSFGLICLTLVITVFTSFGYFRIIRFIWFTTEQLINASSSGNYYTLSGCIAYDASKISLFPGAPSPERLFAVNKLRWSELNNTLFQRHLSTFGETSFALPLFLFIIILQMFGYAASCYIT
jgi:NADH:ubiquinone oxidoreductase subunit 2 (subunit N)